MIAYRQDNMTKNNYWITRHDGGWQAKPEGASRASRVFETQGAAEDYARNILESKPNGQGGELITQSLHGQIRSKDTINSYDPRKVHDYEH